MDTSRRAAPIQSTGWNDTRTTASVVNRLDDAETAETGDDHFDGERDQQDAEHDLRNDEGGWFEPLREFVDVAEDQIIEPGNHDNDGKDDQHGPD